MKHKEVRIARGLKGKRVLVTAGPTREPIDPVRFLTNSSTGKMGFALASAAGRRGAEVILISGPTVLVPPGGVNFIRVKTAREMHRAVFANWEKADVFIAAAAVSDYRPRNCFSQKVKKRGRKNLLLHLEPNPDILREAGELKGKRVLVGFAAETEDLVNNARAKLWEKNLDLIIANDVTQKGAGFAVETNIVKIIDRAGKIESLSRMSKEWVAEHILDRVGEIIDLER